MGVMQLGQLANRNIYSYCDCNPISFSDANGTFKIGNLNIRREDLKNDWMGIKILWWYLFGGGRDRIFKSNKWGNYIKNTKLCQCGKCSGKYPDRTLYQYTIDQLKPYSANLAEGETLKVPTLRMKVAITNGEGIVGYNYLHGVSYDIENGLYGYQVDATITKSNGFTVYRIKSTWHDAIDPNFVYATDRAKASFAQTIPFADPQNYNLIVSWEDIYIENSEGIGLAY